MRKNFSLLTLIGLGTVLSVTAQTNKSKNQSTEPAPAGAKSAFISNQDYLSGSSVQSNNAAYGDSLKGFNENAVKAELLTHNVYGEEYLNYIKVVKRDYINKKYKIGTYAPKVLTPVNTPNNNSNSKPIGGSNYVNVFPCINEDFELTTPGPYFGAANSLAIQGWTISQQPASGCNPNPTWTPGSPKCWVRTTPILGVPAIGTLPNSPLGGVNVVQMNDNQGTYSLRTKISQTFPVTQANTLFQFAYAGAWNDGGHACCEQPALEIQMYNCTNGPLTCSSLSLNASGSGCPNGASGYSVTAGTSWTSWVVKYIDLTPFIGSCVTIEAINKDCIFGGHWGQVYFDARCGGQLVGTGITGNGGSIGGPVSFCAGSNQAMIAAPLGYSQYQWYGPGGIPIAAPAGTMANLIINNPIPGTVYTADLTTPSGCVFVSTNTLSFSQVQIIGTGTGSTCPGGASGTATVVANGSGTGYNYTWINAANNATVGTAASVASLAPGVYSIQVSGLGSSSCGSAVATVTINTGPPGITNLLKPFCLNQAYLNTAGGTNYQWYNNLTPIAPPLGTAPGYTVNNPGNGQIYWLSYLSSQGCQDSIKYTLVSSTPGNMFVANVKLICPGGNNGTALINMTPAPGAPPGLNSYSVFSTGTTAPYTASLYPTFSNTFQPSGLSAGTYSVSGFDGSCRYGVNFQVVPHVYNFSLTPNSPTLCPGNSISAGVNFGAPVPLNQYTYTWTPTTFLAGLPPNNGSYQTTIITPTTAVGTQTTIIYSITVKPTIVDCPITKTLAITIVNPAIPTIQPIPNLCNTSAPFQIVASPAGGTFSTGVTGTNNPIGVTSGIISPTLAFTSPLSVAGTNTFVYSTAVNTCTAKKTGSFQVSQFNTAGLTNTVPALCVTSPVFNLMNIVQSSASGTWMPGPGIVNNQFNPSSLTTGNYIITYSTTSSPNPTVCPASSQLTVSVTNTMVPVINQVPPFCTNSTPITLTVSPSGGGWTGNSAVSNAGVITPANAAVPSSQVTYTVMVGPCLNTAVTTLNTSTFFPASFTGPLSSVCFNSNPVNLMGIVQVGNGAWYGPGQTNAQGPNVIGSAGSYSFIPGSLASGTYALTYKTTSSPMAGLCDDVKTIPVTVVNPVLPNISQVGPFCNNAAPMTLAATPADGHWTSSAYLSSNGVFTPSLTSVGNNAVQYISGTNTCFKQETKFINIEAFIPATVMSNVPDLCNTSPAFNLLPITLSNQGVWSGNGIVGTSFNPALVGAGNFVLTHNTSSFPSGLCPDQATIAVNVYSLATPIVTKAGPYCTNSAPVQLQVSPVGGLFGAANEGIVTLKGKFNPASAFIGNNLINYSITSGPCVAYAQATVVVEKFVSADFEKPVNPFCRHDQPVNMNGYVQNPGGNWSGTGMVGNMFDPGKANAGNTNLITYETHSEPTHSLCPDVKTVRVEVREMPVVTAAATSEGGCAPVEIAFNTPNVNAGHGVWTIGDGSEPKSGLNATHIFTTPGTYTVMFTYSDDIGCVAPAAYVTPVTVYQAPKADFSVPDEIMISEPMIQITNLTTVISDNTYSWKISGINGLPMNDVNPKVDFPKIGKYQVTLIATSSKGCKDEITKTIEVKNDFNIFIPNSFSPNFDGLNDVFIPVFTQYGLDLKSFDMEIFDRWGHVLYHTKDVTKGWDGSVQNKGEPLKEEVYIYRIKYKDMDGNSYNKMGHMSLVK